MPKIYRSMFAEGGKPKVGTESKMLGVRLAPHPQADISVDTGGNVHPQTGGMSVAPEVRRLPYFLIPKRLRGLIPDACGSDKLVCWSMGAGPFQADDLTDKLALSPDPSDPENHGFVEPKHDMTIDDYQQALAHTRDQWTKDES